MWPNPQEAADLVTFTEEILNGKLHSSVQCIFLWFMIGKLMRNSHAWTVQFGSEHLLQCYSLVVYCYSLVQSYNVIVQSYTFSRICRYSRNNKKVKISRKKLFTTKNVTARSLQCRSLMHGKIISSYMTAMLTYSLRMTFIFQTRN